MRKIFWVGLATLALTVAACSKGTQESATGSDFQPVREGRIVSAPGVEWLFDGPAETATDGDGVLLRLPATTGVTRVFETTPVEAGKTYELAVTVERSGGSAPADVRVILSRECVEAAEEFAQTNASVAPGETKAITVSHTFKQSYPCAKMVLHAQSTEPVVLSIAGAELTPKS